MPKKTVKLIVESGNDYVIAVKANQSCLHQQIKTITHSTNPTSIEHSFERSRDRYTHRKVSVFEDLSGISPQWLGLKRLIKVERTGTRSDLPYHQVVYYISSLTVSALEFAKGIRGHWGIENRLHWVKDVVFNEDSSCISQLLAAANFSIIRSIVINLVRCHGYASLTSAMRLIAHDLDAIFKLLNSDDSTINC
ncbi:MAG TPA: ISAs1 family transposase [Oculatellaceae cyanobacterium]